MLRAFVDGYEQGYATGLRLATAMPDEPSPVSEAEGSLEELTAVMCRPAYQQGFMDGLRDGSAVLASALSAADRWRRRGSQGELRTLSARLRTLRRVLTSRDERRSNAGR
jgi:hypothetical protein